MILDRRGRPMFLGGGAPASPWHVAGAAPKIGLLPAGIVSAAGVVTDWAPLPGSNGAALLNGSPTLDTSSGLSGVAFAGATQFLQATASFADNDFVLFVVCKTVVDTGGGRSTIFEASDTGAANRSILLWRAFTSTAGRDAKTDPGDAAAADALLFGNFRVHRLRFSSLDRYLVIDGINKAGNANSSTSRTVTRFRLGQQNNATDPGALPWNGVICAVLGYVGSTMTIQEEERIDKQLRTLFGITEPYLWASVPAATNAADDPRFPPTTTIYAVAGDEVRLYFDSSHLYDGKISQTWSSSSAALRTRADHVALTLPAAGTETITLVEAGGTSTTTIEAHALPTTGSATIEMKGDSNGARAQSMQVVKSRLGSLVTFRGSFGPVANYTEKYSSIDSATFATHDGSGVPQASPDYNGGGAYDFPGHFTAIGGAPHVRIWVCGLNASHSLAYADVDAALTTDFARFENNRATMLLTNPTIEDWLVDYWPPDRDLAWYENSAANQYAAHKNDHRLMERLNQQFGEREAEGIRVIRIWQLMPTFGARMDAIHGVQAPFGAILGGAVCGMLAKFKPGTLA